MSFIKDESASATILEFTIVLPLCLIMIAMLFFLGFILSRQAVLDAAADRAGYIIRCAYADPNYLLIADLGVEEIDTDYLGIRSRKSLYGYCKGQPYRFLFDAFDRNQIEAAVVKKVRQIVETDPFFYGGTHLSDVQTDVVQDRFFTNGITVTVRQNLMLPFVTGVTWKAPLFRMEATSEVLLSCPPEMIRNVDFVLDLTERYSGVDIKKKLSDILSKAATFVTGD